MKCPSGLRHTWILGGVLLLVLCLGFPSIREDLTLLGGDLTANDAGLTAMQLPAPNLQPQELVEEFFQGHFHFHRSFDVPDRRGKNLLGPVFNHSSCGGCHRNDGRGRANFSQRLPGSQMLVKVSLKGALKADGSPRQVRSVGEQLRDHKLDGSTQFNIRLRWRYSSGTYADGTPYTLRRPALKFNIPGVDSKKVATSLRQTPPVVGSGLLEAVPDEDIIAMSDPDDLNGDGISGRISYVPDHISGKTAIGRFGFRASNPTVKQQSAGAFFNDMGVSNEIFPGNGKRGELSSEILSQVELYMQGATVPAARNQDHPDVMAGKAIFSQIGCNGCHVPTLRTLSHPLEAVNNQTFHPFTDLLLHDMGPGLADGRAEFSASGSEWRTSPLWALGLAATLLDATPSYLHDGRARTLEEAILWHGGEGQPASDRFKALSASERAQLVAFLQSL